MVSFVQNFGIGLHPKVCRLDVDIEIGQLQYGWKHKMYMSNLQVVYGGGP